MWWKPCYKLISNQWFPAQNRSDLKGNPHNSQLINRIAIMAAYTYAFIFVEWKCTVYTTSSIAITKTENKAVKQSATGFIKTEIPLVFDFRENFNTISSWCICQILIFHWLNGTNEYSINYVQVLHASSAFTVHTWIIFVFSQLMQTTSSANEPYFKHISNPFIDFCGFRVLSQILNICSFIDFSFTFLFLNIYFVYDWCAYMCWFAVWMHLVGCR